MKYNTTFSGPNRQQRTQVSSQAGTLVLRRANLEDVVFVNVESVPELANFYDLTGDMQRLWTETAKAHGLTAESEEELYHSAGLFAEFGKVVCISVGVVRYNNKETKPYFITTTYANDDECSVLADFADMLDRFMGDNPQGHYVAGHNIRRADIPFFGRRMLINNLELPTLFDPQGRRPLTANIIDTADFWAFGDMTAQRVSAETLAHVFGIDCETGDYTPTVVAELYHHYADRNGFADMDAIIDRSERKVLLVAQLMRRFRGETLIDTDHVRRKADNK